MADLALEPVSAAVFALLRGDATLMALIPGGISDSTPQGAVFPRLLYVVRERDIRGFGTGGLPEVELRIHAFTQTGGMRDLQAVVHRVIVLLKDATITVTGYTQCGKVFYDETVPLPNSEIAGLKVHELVAMFRIYVEEAA